MKSTVTIKPKTKVTVKHIRTLKYTGQKTTAELETAMVINSTDRRKDR